MSNRTNQESTLNTKPDIDFNNLIDVNIENKNNLNHGEFYFNFSNNNEFNEIKWNNYKIFTKNIALRISFLGTLLWLWDLVIDPIGSSNTFFLRILYIPIFLFMHLCIDKLINRNLIFVFITILTLCAQFLFMAILSQLKDGMVHGIGGFLYFCILGLIIMQGFDFKMNLAFDLLITLFPHFLGILNLVNDFPHMRYGALMWPATILISIAQYAFCINYGKRYLAEQNLEKLSQTDALTGLFNRRYMHLLLSSEFIRSNRLRSPLSIFIINIDNFKKINDNYGHLAGDLVLKEIGNKCKSTLRDIDGIARWGGEEFLAILPGTPLNGGLDAAERIRHAVYNQSTVVSTDQNIQCTVSIGVATFNEPDETPEKMISRADIALYEAKRNGRNQVFPQKRALIGAR